ncbi:hypothetical protein AB1Y20_015631 [Prymnesium parvum]|uniref:Uncharacterized protein n=1 Tax=Prymnesium parvum TaxID=97485 RepID=A0AB34JYB4_PRYPA
MQWPCCQGVPWHREECPVYGRAAGGAGPFTQDSSLQLAAPRQEAPAAPSQPSSSRHTFANDAGFWMEQVDRAAARQHRFADCVTAPQPQKKTMAWAGGKITSNKAEAIEAFIARKQREGGLDVEQERALRASLNCTSKAKVQRDGKEPQDGEGSSGQSAESEHSSLTSKDVAAQDDTEESKSKRKKRKHEKVSDVEERERKHRHKQEKRRRKEAKREKKEKHKSHRKT